MSAAPSQTAAAAAGAPWGEIQAASEQVEGATGLKDDVCDIKDFVDYTCAKVKG